MKGGEVMKLTNEEQRKLALMRLNEMLDEMANEKDRKTRVNRVFSIQGFLSALLITNIINTDEHNKYIEMLQSKFSVSEE